MAGAANAGRLLLAGGLVIDGTGAPPRRADVLLEDDRIVAVGPADAMPGDASRIDVTGRIVAPGFIDSHTHDDGYVLAHPDMLPKVSQGVTTVVTGNCGVSLAPLVRHDKLPQPLDLLGPAALFRFASFRSWIEALRQTPAAVNVIPLVGHTTLRVAVMDDTQRAATAPEVQRMQALLDEALQAGAFGMSTGTFYPPAAHAPTEEIIQVGQPLRTHGGVYATHLRCKVCSSSRPSSRCTSAKSRPCACG